MTLSRKTILWTCADRADRLRLQHELTKTNCDGLLLHPLIPSPAPKSLIADVATGTGAWALDLADKHSDVQIEGFDIDLDSVPPPIWTPSNVNWKHLDLLQDNLPEELVGRYDVVQVQYVVLFVYDENFSRVLTNLIRMLKPGGWLQWTECDAPACVRITARGEPALENIKFTHMAHQALGNWMDNKEWLKDLQRPFESAGLQDVAFQRIVPKGSTMQPLLMSGLWAMEDGLRATAARADLLREKIDPVLEQWRSAVDEAQREKVGIDMKIIRGVGRKAS